MRSCIVSQLKTLPPAPVEKKVEEEGETLFESELNDMDWGAAADEVDAYLDSAITASNTSSPAASVLAEEDVEGVEGDVGGSKKRQRVDDVESTDYAVQGEGKKHRADEETDDDDGGDSFLDDLAEELDGQLDNE